MPFVLTTYEEGASEQKNDSAVGDFPDAGLLVTLEDMLYMALLLAMRLAPEAPDAPLKQPQMAVQGSTIAMTYGIGNRVYFVRSTDAGKTFSKPVKVAEAPFVALGMHRGPRIVLAGKDTV